jgi:hypothetical protein
MKMLTQFSLFVKQKISLDFYINITDALTMLDDATVEFVTCTK